MSGSAGLDLSEFPALANRSRLESLSRVEGVARLETIGGVSAPASSMVSRPSYGVVSKPAEPPPDFSIHNEDFPALPGSNTFKSGTVLFLATGTEVLGGCEALGWVHERLKIVEIKVPKFKPKSRTFRLCPSLVDVCSFLNVPQPQRQSFK